MAKDSNIIKYRKPFQFNIGFVIFLIIILYVIYNVYAYMTSTTIAEYQVTQGNIATNHVYKGLILRDEQLVFAERDGYVNYYKKNGSRISVRDVVYSIDTNGTISNKINSTDNLSSRLSHDALSEISEDIDNYIMTYNNEDFYKTISFKSDLNSQMNQIISSQALEAMSEEIISAEANNTFYKYAGAAAGVVAFYADGYENYTVDEFDPAWLDQSQYVKNQLVSNMQISAGSPAYKVISSEKWNIVIAISEEIAARLADGSSIKIRFCEDDYTTNCAYQLLEMDGANYLSLTMNTAMVRYLDERFCEVELILNETSGLKIPKSAITTKEFYTIPKSCFMEGNDSSELGVLMVTNEKGDAVSEFITPTIYYETDNYYYVDDEYIKAGCLIQKANTTRTYTVGSQTDSLLGVYNINKGYSVFKQISIMYENEEYAIVEPKTNYGIALYDHIALDGSKLNENQLIHDKK